MEKDALNIFTGGIDQASDPIAVAQGDYLHAEYLRDGNPDSQSAGKLEFEIGNKELDIPGMPVGNFVLVGKADWTEEGRNQLVLMMCDISGNNNHTLVLFDIPTEGFTILETSKHYNFQWTDNNRITGAAVVNGQLVYTEGYFKSHLEDDNGIREFNPPRSRNLIRLLNGDYSSPAKFEDLDAIKSPPLVAPALELGTDVGRMINNIYGVGFKFRYAYIYDNNEYSQWSPITELVKTINSDTLSGQNIATTFAENQIKVTVGTGDERVIKIVIAATSEGAQQNAFYVVKVLDKAAEGIPSNNTYDYIFYNDEYSEPIANSELNYDALPDVALRQEILPNKTHMAYANIIEGFDNVELDVTLELRRTEITQRVAPAFPEIGCILDSDASSNDYYIINAGVESLGDLTSDGGTANELYWKFYEGDLLPVSIPNTSVPGGITQVAYYTVTAADITAINAAATFTAKRTYLNTQLMNFAIATFGLTVVAQTTLANGNRRAQLTIALVGDQYWLNRAFVQRKTMPLRNLLPGKKELGIVYLDRAQRDGTVQLSESMIIEVPTEAEDPRTGFADPNNPYTRNIRARITHQPPEWADAYVFVAKVIPEPSVDRRIVTGADVDPNYPNYVRLTLGKYFYKETGIINKEIQEGDELTFISTGHYSTGVGALADFNTPIPYQTTPNKIIVRRYDNVGGIANLEAVYVERTPYIQDVLASGALAFYIVEIITPRKSSNTYLYKEVSEVFRISNPHTADRAHRGNEANQNPTTGDPAIVFLSDYGDCWYRPRAMQCWMNELTPALTNVRDKAIVWVNTSKYSDFYESYWEPYGRLQVFNPHNKRNKLDTGAVHSEAFIAKSAINGLFKYVPNNRVILPPQHGPITSMVSSGGYVLTLIQARKETSIYIQRTFGISGDSVTPSYSDKVFAQTNPLAGDYGTSHGLSVVATEIGLIYWDQISGHFVLSGGNGQMNLSHGQQGEMKLTPISNQLKSDINTAYENGEPVLVTAVDDNLNKEYACTFRIGNVDAEAKMCWTFVFSYGKKRWVRINKQHDVVFAASLGAFNLTTTNTTLNEGKSVFAEGEGDPLTFFTVPVNFKLDYVVNEAPASMKVFRNVNLITNAIEKIIDAELIVPVTQNGNDEMKSFLYNGNEGNWELIDGKMSAKIMGDINSPVEDAFAGNLPYLLACGQDMRGYACIIKLTGTSINRYNIGASLVSFAATNPK